jgi:hypothetical protein
MKYAIRTCQDHLKAEAVVGKHGRSTGARGQALRSLRLLGPVNLCKRHHTVFYCSIPTHYVLHSSSGVHLATLPPVLDTLADTSTLCTTHGLAMDSLIGQPGQVLLALIVPDLVNARSALISLSAGASRLDMMGYDHTSFAFVRVSTILSYATLQDAVGSGLLYVRHRRSGINSLGTGSLIRPGCLLPTLPSLGSHAYLPSDK